MLFRHASNMVRLCGLLLCCHALPVYGHGPATSVLRVLTRSGDAVGGLDVGDPARPDLVGTNVGLLRSRPDGSYDYLGPSQWADGETAPAAALADRSQIATLAAGQIFLSLDGGCNFAPVDRPSTTLQLIDVIAWQHHLWAMGRDGDDAVVLRVTAAGELEVVQRWSGDRAFVPHAITGWASDTHAGLAISGAQPRPALWVASAPRDDFSMADPSLVWRAIETPEVSVTRLSIRAVSAQGELWLQATDGDTRQLWHALAERADLVDAAVWRWEIGGRTLAVMHGPVQVDQRWLAVFDGRVHVRPQRVMGDDAWLAGEAVPWTCLQALDDVIFACTLEALRALEMVSQDGVPSTRAVMTFSQVGPPPDGCPSVGAIEVQLDWVHYAGENGWLDTSPAHIPGAPRQTLEPTPEMDPMADSMMASMDAGEDVVLAMDPPVASSGGDGGCQSLPVQPPPVPWWLWVAALSVGMRARRATCIL